MSDTPPATRAVIGVALIAVAVLLQITNTAGSLNRTVMIAQILGVGAIGFASIPHLTGLLGADEWGDLSLVRQLLASFVLMVVLVVLMMALITIKGILS